ncbi:S8 family serine peptidase [Halorubrum sp. Atlit-28R]|uniref:S8 family serine peptidase n=1 Tax=Halorubrum sp. Atlit-28R TaxID=2282129 RepID=UPI0011C46628|nr:S8 family serine peptidase [Halorubrum sp. Atlit-28R]
MTRDTRESRFRLNTTSLLVIFFLLCCISVSIVGSVAAIEGVSHTTTSVDASAENLAALNTSSEPNSTESAVNEPNLTETAYQRAVENHDPASVVVHPELLTEQGELQKERIILRLGEVKLPNGADRDVGTGQIQPVDQQVIKQQTVDAQAPAVRHLNTVEGIDVKNRYTIINAISVVPEANTSLADLRSIPGVERIHPNYEYNVTTFATNATPDQANINSQRVNQSRVGTDALPDQYASGVKYINAPRAWETFDTKGDGAGVVVLDTGVDPNHQDIDIEPYRWADFDQNGNRQYTDPHDNDPDGHGTHVSGTVVGGNNGAWGSREAAWTGVAPEATFYHGAVLNCDSDGCEMTFEQFTSGMQWAWDQTATGDVISASFGCTGGPFSKSCYNDDMIEHVRNARISGTLVVGATGNSGAGSSGSPGNVYETLSVGSVATTNDEVYDSSSGEKIVTDNAWGGLVAPDPPDSWPDEYIVPRVTAPGCVPSTVPGNEYEFKCGTSMATPHVSGAAALLYALDENDELTEAEVTNALQKTAQKPESWDESDAPAAIGTQDSRYGYGAINVHQAIIELWIDGRIESSTVGPEDRYTQENDAVTAEVTVTNTGDRTHEFFVGYSVQGPDGVWRDNDAQTGKTVELTPGESRDVSLSWAIESDAPRGQYDAKIQMWVENDRDLLYNSLGTAKTTNAFELTTPAEFDTTIQTTEISDGTLQIESTVENTGGITDTQDRVVTINGDEKCRRSLSLAAGASEQTECTYELQPGDGGPVDIEVRTADSSTTATVTAQPATFRVSSTAISSPIEEGERLHATATIQNTGDIEGTKEITFDVPRVGTESTSVYLTAGATERVEFDVPTVVGDNGTYTASVASPDDSVTRLVTVEERPEPATFDISITETNSPVEAGNTLEVTTRVRNIGDVAGTKTVELDVPGVGRDTTSVQLGAGSSTKTVLSVGTARGDDGDYTATVETPNKSDTTAIVISEQPAPAEFVITNLEVNSPLTAGETVRATATVENTGEQRASTDVKMSVSGVGNATKTVTLDGGASDTVEFEIKTTTADTGSYTVIAETDESVATTDLSIEGPPAGAYFTVTIDEAQSETAVGSDQEVSIVATIENTGDTAATQQLTLQNPSDEPVSTQSVTLTSGERRDIVFDWQPAEVPEQPVTVAVVSDNDSDSLQVDPVESDPAIIRGTVTNESNEPLPNVEVVLVADTDNGETTVNTTRTASDGTYVFAGVDPDGQYRVRSTYQGQSSQATIPSLEPGTTITQDIVLPGVEPPRAAFRLVQPDPETLSAQSGETRTVSATVWNTGTETATQRVTFRGPAGTVVDTTEVTLGANQTTSVTFAFTVPDQTDTEPALTIATQTDSVVIPLTIEEDADDSYRYHVPFTNNDQELSSAKTSALRLTAQEAATKITIDSNANGTGGVTRSLAAGETVTISEPAPGATIEATEPLTVRYQYRSSNFGAYEDGEKAYGIPEESLLGNEYILPLAADAVWLAAPVETDVRVDKDGDQTAETTITVPENGATSVTGVAAGTQFRADGPVHLVAEHADWEGMDQTYAYTPLAVEQARTQYTVTAEPTFSRENPESRSEVVLAATANDTTVTVRPDGEAGDSQTLQAGETYSFETRSQLNLTASAPVVPVYSYRVMATDPWTGDRRDYHATWTPVPEQQVRQGSWSGTSEHVAGWSTFDIEPAGPAATIEWTKLPPATVQVGDQLTVSVAGTVDQAETVSLVADTGTESEVIATETVSTDWSQSSWELTVGEELSVEPGTNVTLRAVVGPIESPVVATATELTVEAAADTQVGLVPPSDPVPSGNVVEVPVVVRNTTDGISAYNITVAVANTSVATITDVSLTNNPEFPDTTVQSNETAVIAAGMGNNAFPAATETTVATVTLQSQTPGTTRLRVDNQQVAGEQVQTYDLLPAETGELAVTTAQPTPDPVVGELPPRDPDGDGAYEDINGDGEVDVFDVQALYENLDTASVQEYPQSFNFAEDSDPTEVTVFDIQALYGGI